MEITNISRTMSTTRSRAKKGTEEEVGEEEVTKEKTLKGKAAEEKVPKEKTVNGKEEKGEVEKAKEETIAESKVGQSKEQPAKKDNEVPTTERSIDLPTSHEPLGVTYENAPPNMSDKMENALQDDFFNLPPIRRANKEAKDPEVLPDDDVNLKRKVSEGDDEKKDEEPEAKQAHLKESCFGLIPNEEDNEVEEDKSCRLPYIPQIR